jgi:hypothetical protein
MTEHTSAVVPMIVSNLTRSAELKQHLPQLKAFLFKVIVLIISGGSFHW